MRPAKKKKMERCRSTGVILTARDILNVEMPLNMYPRMRARLRCNTTLNEL